MKLTTPQFWREVETPQVSSIGPYLICCATPRILRTLRWGCLEILSKIASSDRGSLDDTCDNQGIERMFARRR